jgi:dTMP kinase
VRAINEFGAHGLRPDRTLLLSIDPAVGRARALGRAGPPDRLEREADEFFRRTASAYLELWAADPARIRKLDAAQPPEHVLAAALAELADLL